MIRSGIWQQYKGVGEVISATIVSTCKGRLHHLRDTFPIFAATGLPVVVVDFDDPDHCGNWVDAQFFQTATVVRHINQPFFNPSLARNSGASVATTEWLVFLDADRIIGADFFQAMQQVCVPGQFCLHGAWTRNYNGITIVRKSDHDAVGGWPAIPSQSYGFEDTEYALLLMKERGLKVVPWPGSLDHIEHDDKMRTKHYPIKDLGEGHAENVQIFKHYYGKRLDE